MFSSFNFFQAPEPETAMDKAPQFKTLLPLLKELRGKEIKVKAEVGGNPVHPNFPKSHVLTTLVNEVDRITDHFNSSHEPSSEQLKLLSVALVAIKLEALLISCREKNFAALDAKSSAAKEYMKKGVEAAAVGASVAVGVATGSLLLAAVGLLFASPKMSEEVTERSGLNDSRSDSLRIVDDLIKVLNEIYTPLKSLLQDTVFDVRVHSIKSICCPLTKASTKDPEKRLKPINDPAVWLLHLGWITEPAANVIYEKSDIIKWFKAHETELNSKFKRMTPLTLKDVIRTDVRYSDVLQQYIKVEKAHYALNPAIAEEEKEVVRDRSYPSYIN